MRSFVKHLEDLSDLQKVKREVDVKFEIASLIRGTSDRSGPALLFESVKGYGMPVLGGLYAARRRILDGLDLKEDSGCQEFAARIAKPTPPRIMSSGFCQEKVFEGGEVDLSKLPICIHSSKDNPKPYVTAGVAIVKDPEFGRNLSIHRCMVIGRNKLTIYSAPGRHLALYHSRAEGRGEALEAVIAIGVDPVFAIASQIRAPLGVDEAALAGGLRGGIPLDFIKCRSVKLEAPCTSEIVMEGRILPNLRVEEGPFGEYTGYYGPPTMSPVMEVTAVTMRDDALYQTVLTGKPVTENHFMKQLPLEALLYDHLRRVCPGVKDVHFTPGGGCQAHVVVALKEIYPMEAKTVIYSTFSSGLKVKQVIVVNDDIDIRDSREVEWAVAFRSQPSKDAEILRDVLSPPLDPVSEKDGIIGSGLGIDATKPFGEGFPEEVDVPSMNP